MKNVEVYIHVCMQNIIDLQIKITKFDSKLELGDI